MNLEMLDWPAMQECAIMVDLQDEYHHAHAGFTVVASHVYGHLCAIASGVLSFLGKDIQS